MRWLSRPSAWRGRRKYTAYAFAASHPSALPLWASPAKAPGRELLLQHRPTAALRGVSLEPRPLAARATERTDWHLPRQPLKATPSDVPPRARPRYACLPCPPGSASMTGCSLRLLDQASGLRTGAQVLVQRLGPLDIQRGASLCGGAGRPSAHTPAMLALSRSASARCACLQKPLHGTPHFRVFKQLSSAWNGLLLRRDQDFHQSSACQSRSPSVHSQNSFVGWACTTRCGG